MVSKRVYFCPMFRFTPALRGVGGVWKVVLERFVGVGSALRECWVCLVGGVGNGSLSSHYRMYGYG